MIRSLLRALLFCVFLSAWLWGFGTISFGPWPSYVRVFLAVFWGMVAVEYLRPFNMQRRWPRFIFAMILVNLLWALHRPSGQGEWTDDQAKMPVTNFQADEVTIENVRNATYRTSSDYDVVWETRSYDLQEIQSVDFVIEPFALNQNLAHTFLSFGFSDGRHIAISVEIRKQVGQEFSPLKGAFKRFELMYVIGDERDLIGLRANIRKNPVRLYRCVATADQIRVLFEAMLQRANKLAAKPEYYHSVRNNCTSNITWHLEQLGWQDWRLDRRLLFPGRADEVGFERGLLDVEGEFAAVRQRSLINDRSEFGANSVDWSAQIRRVVR